MYTSFVNYIFLKLAHTFLNKVNLVHLFLYTVGDFDKIWREHCEDAETLCEYAVAMKNLADNHWAKTCEGEGRIEWCCR